MTLAMYRARQLALATLVATGCFGLVAAAAVMVETVGQLAHVAGGARLALQLWWLATLECCQQAFSTSLPVAFSFVALQWARRGESLAAAQLGLSTRARMAPVVVCSAACAAGVAVFAHACLPAVVQERNALVRRRLRGGDGLSRVYIEPPTWFRFGENLLFVPSQTSGEAAPEVCENARVCLLRPVVYGWRGGRIASVTRAAALGQHAEGGVLHQAATYFMDAPEVLHRDRALLPRALLPADLTLLIGNPRELPSAELSALIARRQAAGLSVRAHQWELVTRTSGPVASVLLVCVLAPWLAVLDRRRTLAHNVGIAGAGAAAVMVAEQVGHAMFGADGVDAALGAYAPSLAMAAWLLLGRPLQTMFSGRTTSVKTSSLT